MPSISDSFQQFCIALQKKRETVSTIQSRFKTITRRINQNYWDSDSDDSHSIYVGSYGRGTSIYLSDIDIVVELPWEYYVKYNQYSWNGQSALLADLRMALMKTYSTSRIGADGQVVDISFTDGVKFEVVPAFKYSDNSGFCYPDTNHGGSWETMNPVFEHWMFSIQNGKSNGNLQRLCQMLRAWKKKQNVQISGILIDTTAYWFLTNYQYADKSYIYYDWICRDYFKFLLDHSNKMIWDRPGHTGTATFDVVIKSKAQYAYDKSMEAIHDGEEGLKHCWLEEWRDIFGADFPDV